MTSSHVQAVAVRLQPGDERAIHRRKAGVFLAKMLVGPMVGHHSGIRHSGRLAVGRKVVDRRGNWIRLGRRATSILSVCFRQQIVAVP